jgi:hypothetical protein
MGETTGYDCDFPDSVADLGGVDQVGGAQQGGGGLAAMEAGRNFLWDKHNDGTMYKKKCLALFIKLGWNGGPGDLFLQLHRVEFADGLQDFSLYADLWAAHPAARASQLRRHPTMTVAEHLMNPLNIAVAALNGTKIAVNVATIGRNLKDTAALVAHETFHTAGFDDSEIQKAWFNKVNPKNTSNISKKFKSECL